MQNLKSSSNWDRNTMCFGSVLRFVSAIESLSNKFGIANGRFYGFKVRIVWINPMTAVSAYPPSLLLSIPKPWISSFPLPYKQQQCKFFSPFWFAFTAFFSSVCAITSWIIVCISWWVIRLFLGGIFVLGLIPLFYPLLSATGHRSWHPLSSCWTPVSPAQRAKLYHFLRSPLREVRKRQRKTHLCSLFVSCPSVLSAGWWPHSLAAYFWTSDKHTSHSSSRLSLFVWLCWKYTGGKKILRRQ